MNRSARDLNRAWQDQRAIIAFKLYSKCKSLKIVASKMGLRSPSSVSNLVKRGIRLLGNLTHEKKGDVENKNESHLDVSNS
jgi:hypothetical protein